VCGSAFALVDAGVSAARGSYTRATVYASPVLATLHPDSQTRQDRFRG
jgi:hypothetical protein